MKIISGAWQGKATALVTMALSACIAHATTLDQELAQSTHKLIVADFDGDQLADVLIQNRPDAEHQIIGLVDVANEQRWRDGFLSLAWNHRDANAIVGDFNGDAISDVLLQARKPASLNQLILANPSGGLGEVAQTIGDYHLGLRWDESSHRLLVGDFNGDFRDDIFLQGLTDKHRHGLALADEQGTLQELALNFDYPIHGLSWSVNDQSIVTGDFDGDGKSELLLQSIRSGDVAQIGHGAAALDRVEQIYGSNHLNLDWRPQNHRLLVGDFNGDIRDDVILFPLQAAGASDLVLATAAGLQRHQLHIDQIPRHGEIEHVLVGDFDADGIDELVLLYRNMTHKPVVLFADAARAQRVGAALQRIGLISPATVIQNLEGVSPASGSSQGPTGFTGNTGTTSTALFTQVVSPSLSKLEEEVQQQSSTEERAPLAANGVGRLAGAAETQGGTASYSIPVALPPGRAGMQPTVSLSYSSRAGNGVVGMGWSLNAGQSSIHRCANTVAQDGVNRSVRLDNQDKLCLDGQRLVLTAGTVYGAANSEYRTEIESFAKVKANKDFSAADSSFTVTHADGRKSFYKRAVVHEGVTAPVSWLLSSTQDPHNNNIEYVYQEPTTGEVLLSEVRYTGTSDVNGSTLIAGTRAVRFNYENREDFSVSYLAGGKSQQTRRLLNIETVLKNGGSETIIRRYTIGYSYSRATQRSLLGWVQECASNACLPETRFGWRDEPVSYVWENVGTPYGLDDKRWITDAMPTADYNGDGVLDWRKHYVNAEGAIVGSHPTTITNCIRQLGRGVPSCMQPDFNRDGITDSIKASLGPIQYALTNPQDSQQSISWIDTDISLSFFTGVGQPDELRGIQDYNGDSWPDLLVYHTNGGPASLVIYLHTGNIHSPFTSSAKKVVFVSPTATVIKGYQGTLPILQEMPTTDAQATHDVDGNGLTDFLLTQTIDSYGRPVMPMNTNGVLYSAVDANGNLSFSSTSPCPSCTPISPDPLEDILFPDQQDLLLQRIMNVYLDVNGDGLTDWLKAAGGTNGGLYLAINRGASYEHWQYIGALTDLPWRGGAAVNLGSEEEPDWRRTWIPQFDFAIRAMDVDGDGKEELLMPKTRVVEACTYFEEAVGGGSVGGMRCGDDLYKSYNVSLNVTEPMNSYLLDDSLYEYEAWKFQLAADGSWSYVKTSPGLFGSSGQTAIIDAFGKGLPDLMTTLGCRYENCTYPGTGSHAAGVWINRNKGSATGAEKYHPTDIIVSAQDGFANSNSWTYKPLTTGDVNTACPSPDAGATRAFYNVARDYTPWLDATMRSGYMHFASSMYAVFSASSSNGQGETVKQDYCYRGAVYNVEGRGFQGFRTVIERTDASANSSKALRTVTTFHQKFPDAGLLDEQTVRVDSASGTLLARSKNVYISHIRPYGDDKTWSSYIKKAESERWDLDGSSLGKTTSEILSVDGLGNITSARTTVDDAFQTHVTDTSATYNLTTPACLQKQPDSQQVSATVTEKTLPYSASHGVTTTRNTAYTYTTQCKPDIVTREPDNAALRQATDIDYDSYGNASKTTATGGSGATAVNRVSRVVFEADGYLPDYLENGLGHRTEVSHDQTHGQLLSSVDPFGNTVTISYDDFGRLATRRTNLLPTETTVYSGDVAADGVAHAKYKVTVTHPQLKPTTITWFDAQNRPLRSEQQDPLNSGKWVRQQTEYDKYGRIRRQSVPHYSTASLSNDDWTRYNGYDVLDRPASKSLPNDVSTSPLTVSYDYAGLTTNIQVGPDSAYTVSRSKNALGQWWRVTDQGSELSYGNAEPLTTHFRYDGFGNPVLISRAGINNTASYNVLGQKTTMTDPDRGNWQFQYNVAGELVYQQDAEAQETWLSYDDLGRVTARDEAKPGVARKQVASWTFGNLCGVGAPVQSLLCQSEKTGEVTKHYSYQANGLLAGTSYAFDAPGEQSKTFTLGYTYDSYDRPSTITYPNGRVTTTQHYNSQGFAYQLTADNLGSAVQQIDELDAFGNVLREQHGNGLNSTREYSSRTGRIASQCVNASAFCNVYSAGNVQAISYGGTASPWYDAYGNLLQQQNLLQGVSETFAYDRRMRLVQSARKAALGNGLPDLTTTVDYRYDVLGNLIQKGDFAAAIDYLSNKPHQADKAWKDAGKTQLMADYHYDGNGNLTGSSGLADYTRTLSYNHQHVPTSIVRGTASSAFGYDEGNERYFEKHSEAGKTTRIWKIGKLFEYSETTESGVTTAEEKHYLTTVAQFSYKPAQNGKAACSQWRYFHGDRLGSIETVTNQAGQVIERHGFDPFGKPRQANWMLDNTRDGLTTSQKGLFSRITTRGFTGHDHVDAVGLVHMNGRAYDPELGRFLSVDPFMQAPLNGQSLNPYSYVMNNPLAGTDPTGYRSLCKTNVNCETIEVNGGSTITVNGKAENGAEVTVVIKVKSGVEATGLSDLKKNDIQSITISDGESVFHVINTKGGTETTFIVGGSGRGYRPSSCSDSCHGTDPVPPDFGGALNRLVDGLQGVLGVAGLIPAIGAIPDLINAGISAVRGNFGEAALNLAAAVPFSGEYVAAMRVAKSIGGDVSRSTKIVPGKLYHYTYSKYADDIARTGLDPAKTSAGKVFTTSDGTMSGLQAQLDLALPPNRGVPDALLEIDTKVLREMGIEIPDASLVKRDFNMPGGGHETVFQTLLPPEAIKRVR